VVSVDAPSISVTEPVGVPVPEAGLTATEKITLAPNATEVALACSAVVVATSCELTVTEPDPEALLKVRLLALSGV
jgi:hypothetical protein